MGDDKSCLKKPLEECQDETDHQRYSKAKRIDVEVPMANVDLKLAEKLDSILRISFNSSKPKFLTNRPKDKDNSSSVYCKQNNEKQARLKHKDLTKDQLKQRLLTKYETLVPEMDPNRPKVRVVKILSASESIELGKDQAKKQMERQLELNSVGHNRDAFKHQLRKFKFNDGYEQATSNNKLACSSRNRRQDHSKNVPSKSVKFAEEASNDDDDDEDGEVTDEDDFDEANEDFIDND